MNRPKRRRHCGHGTPLDETCGYCAEDIDPDDYWDIVRVINALRRDRGRPHRKARAEKRDKHDRPNHTMRHCDVCFEPMLLDHDRPCAMTPRCTGWHTLERHTS